MDFLIGYWKILKKMQSIYKIISLKFLTSRLEKTNRAFIAKLDLVDVKDVIFVSVMFNCKKVLLCLEYFFILRDKITAQFSCVNIKTVNLLNNIKILHSILPCNS